MKDQKFDNRFTRIRVTLTAFAAIVYLCALVYLTLFSGKRSSYVSNFEDLGDYWKYAVNLTPFRTIREYYRSLIRAH